MISSTVERVNKAWDRIDAWYAKNAPDWTLSAGATDEEIDILAKNLNVTLPEEFRVSLKRHNGIDEGIWPNNWLMPIESIQATWETVTELAKNDHVKSHKVNTDEIYQQKYWCERWVPVDANGTSSGGLIMDLSPGPKGRIGQLIHFNHKKGPIRLTYPDYASYLEDMADQLEKGKYVVEDDYLEINDEDGADEGKDKDEEGEEGEEDGEEQDGDEEEEKSHSKKKVKI